MKGKVIKDVSYEGHRSEFDLQVVNENRLEKVKIKSIGRQALLDYLFIRKGQMISLEGEINENEINGAKTNILIKENV